MYHHIQELPPATAAIFSASPVSAVDGCLLWQGEIDRYGYGALRVRHEGHRHVIGAHRLAYLIHRGTIPDGMVIDHLCRVRACVNAAHLDVVTNHENLLRGRPVHQLLCRHGHTLSGANVRIYRGKRVCKECGRRRVREHRARSTV